MADGSVLDRIREIAEGCGGTVSVAVRSISNAEDFALNDDVVLSSASIIKIPMLVEAMRRVREGTLSLEAEFTLADEARVKGSGVMRYLHTGTILTLKDLLWLTIVVSDNSATNILVDLLGCENVNSTMASMGYSSTRLNRKMYDWEMIEKGLDNVCSAREIADLLVRIAGGQAVGGEYDEMILEMLKHQQDTDRLGMLLPEEAKLANKTGSREGIMHDCGIVTTKTFSNAICVFTKDAKTRADAIMAIARISRAVYDQLVEATGNRQ